MMSIRAALAAALALCFLAGSADLAPAATICAAATAPSPEDGALLAFARRMGLAYPEAFRAIAVYLHADGGRALPGCYLRKRVAEARGWRLGGDLWAVAPGAAIGGDRFRNREGRLPPRWNSRYVEADLDYSGGHRGSHRLIFVRGMGTEWLFFVSTNHERSFAAFMPAR
ncbi:MAG TPA: ribonuclease domain-containing protein [Stellaceae bacterium]|nr:ribonuclease domain-containing protein [Stellaceae bacterium]